MRYLFYNITKRLVHSHVVYSIPCQKCEKKHVSVIEYVLYCITFEIRSLALKDLSEKHSKNELWQWEKEAKLFQYFSQNEYRSRWYLTMLTLRKTLDLLTKKINIYLRRLKFYPNLLLYQLFYGNMPHLVVQRSSNANTLTLTKTNFNSFA